MLVAPHAVFIDHRSRTGQLFLVNTGTTAEEITIDLQFGYPATDSLGNVYVRLIERPEPGAPSAAEWIRAFPRRIALQPGERQVVRLLASPPGGLADGEYWTRLIVTSRGATVPVAGVDSVIRAGVAMELRTIISVTYRKGAVQTGVALRDLRVQIESDSLVAWMALEREGSAAYLGAARFQVRDSSNAVVRDWSTPIAVYYTVNRRFSFPLEGIAPGAYTVLFDLTTAREDIPSEQVLPAPPIHRSVGVEVR